MAEDPAGTALAPLESGPPAVSTAQPLSAAAMHYARQSLSPATRRAYASHLRAWEAWCQGRGALPCPAAPALVANHVAELAGVRAHATLTGRLAGAVSGLGAERWGYAAYFSLTFVMSLPALLLLPWIASWIPEAKKA